MAFSFQTLKNWLYSLDRLLMLNGLWRSFEVKGNNLQLPSQRHRRWRVANRLVTSLILQLSGYGNDPFLGKQRADRIRSPSRNYRQILGDAKFSLEDRDALLYCFQVEI